MELETQVELERKFLLAHAPVRLRQYVSEEIEQGYLALESRGAEVRLRKKGNRYFLVAKKGRGGEREGREIRLKKKQFSLLWPLTSGRRSRKVRYQIPWNSYLLLLDVYKGKHRGLKIAEVAFVSARESAAFEPPVWFGREITRDKQYRNRTLASG